jgi:hypothetical protein
VRRFAWVLLLVVPALAGCAGGPHYDFLTAKDCLQRAGVKFHDMTGKLEDGGDGALQFYYGGQYGVLTVTFQRSAQAAADLEDGYSAWARGSDPRMPWATLKVRRSGNVFLAWYENPPRDVKRHVDACLDVARARSIG